MSSARRPSTEETQLAQAQKVRLEAALSWKRLFSFVGFLIMLCSTIVLAIYGPELAAFSAACISLIVLLQALGAHSHLQVVRERRAIYLFPDFSVLQRSNTSDANATSTNK
jgi:hypothetical protein